MFYLINLLDTLILQQSTGNPNAQITSKFTQMPVNAYKTSQVYDDTLNGGIDIFLIMPILIIFLRFVYSVLYEKEYKIAQNLANMGMSYLNYYLSWILWYTIVTLVLSIVFTLIVYSSLLPDANIVLVWLLYFLPTMVMISFGFFLTAFFIKAKSGVLAAIILFLVTYGASIVQDSVGTDNITKNTLFALSPFCGLGKAGAMMVLVQSFYQPFGFNMWSTEVLNFRFDLWFYISILEIIVFVLLGMYMDQVWPKETGVRKHPLFCFMKRKGNKVGRNQIVRQLKIIEKLSIFLGIFQEKMKY